MVSFQERWCRFGLGQVCPPARVGDIRDGQSTKGD